LNKNRTEIASKTDSLKVGIHPQRMGAGRRKKMKSSILQFCCDLKLKLGLRGTEKGVPRD
jgi:hypothetical protein